MITSERYTEVLKAIKPTWISKANVEKILATAALATVEDRQDAQRYRSRYKYKNPCHGCGAMDDYSHGVGCEA